MFISINKSLVAVLDRELSSYKALGVKAIQDAKENVRLSVENGLAVNGRQNKHKPNDKLEYNWVGLMY